MKFYNKDDKYIYSLYLKDSNLSNSFKFINILIKNNYFTEAYEVLNKTEKIVPNKYSLLVNLAEGYYECGKPLDAIRILESIKKLNAKDLFFLGKLYLYNANYLKARKCFQKIRTEYYFEHEYVSKSRKYLNRIEELEKNRKFLETFYDSFAINNTLTEGYIISVKNQNSLNRLNDVAESELYLIYKIDNDKIYLLGLSKTNDNSICTLSRHAYNNINSYFVMPYFYSTNLDNISMVIEKATNYDFDSIIINATQYFEEGDISLKLVK